MHLEYLRGFIIEEIDDFDESMPIHYRTPCQTTNLSLNKRRNDKLQKRTNFLSAVRLICFASIESINVALYYDKFDKFQF